MEEGFFFSLEREKKRDEKEGERSSREIKRAAEGPPPLPKIDSSNQPRQETRLPLPLQDLCASV